VLLVPLVVVFMAIIPAVCAWPEYPGAGTRTCRSPSARAWSRYAVPVEIRWRRLFGPVALDPGSRSAGTEDVNRVAYGLASSVEAHWYFHLQGLDGDHHRRYAQQSAHALPETPEPVIRRELLQTAAMESRRGRVNQ
jgi:hypothetical protein